MGAKNNGLFIAKTEGETILNKKAGCIIIDGSSIKFSKKSRRENRHKDRNYKRKRLARRLLCEIINLSTYNKEEQESIMGLMKNRGYTFLNSTTEFEKLETETICFVKSYLPTLESYTTKNGFEEFFTNCFEDEKELVEALEKYIDDINAIIVDLGNFKDKQKILSDLQSLESRSCLLYTSPSPRD